MRDYRQAWNPDISISSVERKVADAITGARQNNNSSLGYVKDTYMNDLSPRVLSQLSDITKFRYLRLSDSVSKIKFKKPKKKFLHYNPEMNDYSNHNQGMFKRKLALLKEDLSKEFEKDILDIKHHRKEQGKE